MENYDRKCEQDYSYLHRDDVPNGNPTIHLKKFDLGDMIEIFRSFYDDYECPQMMDDDFCDTIKYFAASCFSDCLFVPRDKHQKCLIVGALIKAHNMLNPGQKILIVTNSYKEFIIIKDALNQTGLSVQILTTLSSIHNTCNNAKILVFNVGFLNNNFEAVFNLIPIESVSLLIMNEIFLNRKKYLFLLESIADYQKPRIFATSSENHTQSEYEREEWSRLANLQYMHHGLQGIVSESILVATTQQIIEENVLEQNPLPDYETENYHLEFFKFNSIEMLKFVLHGIAESASVKIRTNWRDDRVEAKINVFNSNKMSLSKLSMVKFFKANSFQHFNFLFHLLFNFRLSTKFQVSMVSQLGSTFLRTQTIQQGLKILWLNLSS